MSKGPHVLVHLNSENSWHDLPGLKLWVADVVVPHRKEVMQSELEHRRWVMGLQQTFCMALWAGILQDCWYCVQKRSCSPVFGGG